MESKVPQPVVLKLVITGTIPSKKNNKVPRGIIRKDGTVYAFLTLADAYKRWHKKMKDVIVPWLNGQKQKHPDIIFPIADMVKFRVLFYFGDSKARDLSNKLESIQDTLKDYGVIKDDSYFILNPISAEGKYLKGQTRTEIYISGYL